MEISLARQLALLTTSEKGKAVRSPVTDTMINQIGFWNVGAVSGGRVILIDDNTISLPVGHGYSVQVSYYKTSDTYTVQRLWKRSGQVKVKGEWGSVYASELGETCYQASVNK